MGIVHIMERGGEDLYEYKKALKMAKRSIETLCDLSEDMEDKYRERGGMRDSEYEDRSGYRRRY